nr:site-specific integrase [uncultured Arsenicibacter sp.]
MLTVKVRFTIIYNRKGKTDRNGKASVVIEAYQNGIRKYFKTGVKIAPGQWDEARKEVRNQPNDNRIIREVVRELDTFAMTFPYKHNRPFSIQDFALLKRVPEPAVKLQSFSEFLTEQIGLNRKEQAYATTNRHERVAKSLLDFNGGKAVQFDDLTYNFIEDFDRFLLRKKQHVNTRDKAHKVIKKYLTLAIKKGLFELKNNPYNSFKLKTVKPEKEILLPGEIKKIEDLQFNPDQKHLAIYRDAFLFAYYTLLRISDVTRLTQKHISKTDKGLIFELVAQKTKKLNRVLAYALHTVSGQLSKPEQILLRYQRSDNNPLFGRSPQKINKYLKEILTLAGIKKKDIHFHSARHSGITFLTSKKVNISYIQQLAQHSKITETQGYIHLSGVHMEEALSSVNWDI